ncbi:alpha/beta hydrolase [Roseibium polysiphoniae]|uniref:Palmitoyl-protein thioesterase ABHD10, mitochondrial n=1 Tax=Roseibium polysiphoniae TaxID=2571221 RepID=A0ABR9CBX0_9HYPH|nr:alpha/beta hydrolase [Roseibium polysiphoniae]MBD8877389.1 alpha/beta hydrolase [Roseibium polysiphoniae]
MSQKDPQFITVGKSASARQIAVCHSPADDGPGLFWLSGFKSDMNGTKALALADHASKKNLRCTRFDYSGHGLSSGGFEDACVSDWLEEALAVFDRFCTGPTVVVGSSMGGWIAMLLAIARRETGLLKGMVLIAPAVDFTEELMWKQRFTDEIREAILRAGRWQQPSAYGDEPYVITEKLIEDGRNHLILDKPLATGCPVTILQGALDPDVPWQHAKRLAEALPDDDVTFSLIPDGDHRLSRPEDIALLLRAVDGLL